MALKDRVIVITGAMGDLRQVVAHSFGKACSNLALIGTNKANLDKLEQDLKMPPEHFLCIAADLTKPETSTMVEKSVTEKYGRVDILLHFVGGWIGGEPVTKVSEIKISSMLEQHLWTTFHLVQVFMPGMLANGWGRIIVVSSPVVANPPANRSPYTIGKSAQEALMLTLAKELKYTGVTANILRVRTIYVKHERNASPSPEHAFWTTPEEIESSIEYLCSDEGGAVNGARFPLYGSP